MLSHKMMRLLIRRPHALSCDDCLLGGNMRTRTTHAAFNLALGIVLGVVVAVMRLSPNPVTYITALPFRQTAMTTVVPMFLRSRSSAAIAIISSLAWTIALRMMVLVSSLPTAPTMFFLSSRGTISMARLLTIASGAMLDYFFPELIEIGDHTIVGMDAMLLTHEFLHDRFRSGALRIGAGCLVGANSTVLAGVTLGDGTTVSAMSLVHKGTPPGAFVGGVPIGPLSRNIPSEGETP